MTVRAIFFGTPAIAVPSLDALASLADVALVVTQPDKPVGRHSALVAPPVKVRALELGLPVEQPVKVRTPDFAERLRALSADVALVIAYGRILPRAVLDAPRRGCLNLHASLLPRWRGAAPIQWAIVRGDRETGITLMQMAEGMDTGPMLAKLRTPIDPDETAGELAERLGRLAAELVPRALSRLEATPQDSSLATLAPVLEKKHGRIDFTKSAREVHDLVRGMNPWPGAYASLPSGTTLKVHRASVEKESLAQTPIPSPAQTPIPISAQTPAPGSVLFTDHGIGVATRDGGIVVLLEVQAEGKKRLDAASFVAGRGIREGDVLG